MGTASVQSSPLGHPSRTGSGSGVFRTTVAAAILLYACVQVWGFRRTLIPDEIRPLLMAAAPWRDHLEIARQDIVQTPLSYLMARVWLGAFGQTDLAAKLLALAIGCGVLALTGVLARRITKLWGVALVLGTLTLLRVGSAPNLVRMYGLLLLWIAVAMLVWERWLRNPRGSLLGVWALVMILAAWTHASALLLLPAFLGSAWVAGRRSWKTVGAMGVPVLGLLPWIAYVAPVLARRGLSANIATLRMDPTRSLALLPYYTLTGEEPGGGSPLALYYRQHWPTLLKWSALVLMLGMGLLAVDRLIKAWRWRTLRTPTGLWLISTTALLVVPCAVLYVVSLLGSPVIHARYLLVTLPAWWLLAGLLVQERPSLAVPLVLAATLWIGASVFLAARLNRTPSDARADSQLLASRAADGDLIIVDHAMPLGWQFYWELTRRLGRSPDRVAILPDSWVSAFNAAIVPPVPLMELPLRSTDRVWYVHRGDPRREAEVAATLAAAGFDQGTPVEPTVRVFGRASGTLHVHDGAPGSGALHPPER